MTFDLDLAGWTVDDVTFRELGPCSRHITMAAEKLGPRSFRIYPAGPAGRWAVNIFGRGPGGDAVTTIEWQTPTAGQLSEQATGSAAVLADLDRRYSPDAATITATGAGGDSVDVTAPRSEQGKSATAPAT